MIPFLTIIYNSSCELSNNKLEIDMVDYYEQNYQLYHQTTFNIDPSSFLSPLTQFLPVGSSILDIGCGSGRDILWLKQKGYQLTGLERSSSLARLAGKNTACKIIEADFTTFDFSTLSFDALLAIGSLVHLEQDLLLPILMSITKALKPHGHMLLTLKEGNENTTLLDGRPFTLWQQSHLREIFHSISFDIINFSRQVSRIRKNEVWLGYVLKQKMVNQ